MLWLGPREGGVGRVPHFPPRSATCALTPGLASLTSAWSDSRTCLFLAFESQMAMTAARKARSLPLMTPVGSYHGTLSLDAAQRQNPLNCSPIQPLGPARVQFGVDRGNVYFRAACYSNHRDSNRPDSIRPGSSRARCCSTPRAGR